MTYTRSAVATSRRGNWAGPLFNGQRCVNHLSIDRFQRIVPLKASRAINVHSDGANAETGVASSKM